MKKFFGGEKAITKMLVLFVMVGLIVFLGALKVKSSQNPGDGWGYYMPWGYYASGYQYWTPSPVGGNHSNGALIRGTTDPVYLLENGDKRWIKSPTVLSCQGFAPSGIITVSDAEVDSYASVSDLLCPSGTLLKGTAAAVYVVNEDAGGNYTKRHITSPAIFEAAGFNWSNIYSITDEELAWYTAGSDFDDTSIARPNGSLVKVPYLPEVYVLEYGQKRWVVSPTAFASNNYSWSKIITVSMMELNAYTTGDPVRAARGTLLKVDGSPEVYVVDLVAGTYYRRWITTGEVFTSKGYNWANLNIVSQTELDTYTDALEIT